MINQEDAELGQSVWLRPATKQAPPECYRRLAAVLVSYDKWPMVLVRVFPTSELRPGYNPDIGKEMLVHRDNVGLNPKVIKREKGGDMVGSIDDAPERKVRVLGRPVPPIDGQDVLF